MVGLNHEFARELLWREYPTDQRPSTLPAVLGCVERTSTPTTCRPRTSPRSSATSSRIHEWPPESHARHAQQPAARTTTGRRVVLVIRGDLLKRYPEHHHLRPARALGQPPGSPERPRRSTTRPARRRDAERSTIRTSRFPIFRAPGRARHLLHRLRPAARRGARRSDARRDGRGQARASIPADSSAGSSCCRRWSASRASASTSTSRRRRAGGSVKWDNLSWDNLGAAAPRRSRRRRFAIDAARHPDDGGADWGSQRRRHGVHPLPEAGAGRGARAPDAREASSSPT